MLESYKSIIKWYFNLISEQLHLNSLGDEIFAPLYASYSNVLTNSMILQEKRPQGTNWS